MKNIFKYSFLVTLLVAMTGLTACQNEELDTDQYSGKLALAAIAPNPVMRGGELRIIGSNLEKVSEVRFAGGTSVTSIQTVTSGSRSEIRLTVPMDAEVGPVTIVASDGAIASTRFDLEFTEPMVLTSFSPAEVLSGDVVTVKGEYLNNVQEVILGGVYITEFGTKTRNELTFTVPSNAVTGYVIIGDVNEITDQTAIPNQIYSETELIVGDPTVARADTTTYKSGDAITVTGEHLDMIEKVDLTGATEVEFTVAEDGKSISFNLPASASDGEIKLTSFAGKEFPAGAIISLNVTDLEISPLAEDGRYKAGSEVAIEGADLDLVTKVEFNGAEAQWYLDGSRIVAGIPAGAKDGSVTLTLGSGKKAYTDEITVVKPVANKISASEAVAGQMESIVVNGTDLDLITSVTIGDKVKGLVDCAFSADNAETVGVAIPKGAYTGVLTLTAENGDFTQTSEIAITYNEVVSITFDQPTYALGRKITISGSNLMKVETINIKGKKVISYSERKDDAMAFDLPEGMGPGVYKLDLGLIDGSELTWAVPFEITAPYTETFIWEGSRETGDYANNLELGGEDDWVNNELAVGDVVRVYFTAANPSEWSMQLFTGHWAGMSMLFPGLDNPNQFNQDRNPDAASQGYIAFEVTEEIFNLFTEKQWWGSALIVQGKFLTVTGISFLHFGATETVVWEGTSNHTGDYANNIELGGEDDWVNAELWEGAEIRIYFTPDDLSDWSIQVFDGHWGGMGYVTPNGVQFNNENDPDAPSRGYISFKAEGNAFQALTSKQYWGSAIILQGKNLVFTKLAYI